AIGDINGSGTTDHECPLAKGSGDGPAGAGLAAREAASGVQLGSDHRPGAGEKGIRTAPEGWPRACLPTINRSERGHPFRNPAPCREVLQEFTRGAAAEYFAGRRN